MTEVTTNGIVKWTNSDPSSIVQASQAQGDSIELALSKRERFDFVWANTAERTAQTGMVQGSRGYQVDTKTEYLYDNSNWRLATAYIEFNNGTSGSPQVYPLGSTAPASMVVNPSLSTDTTFITFSAGAITFLLPGLYSISWTLVGVTSPPAGSYAAIYTTPALNEYVAINGFSTSATTVAAPIYRIAAANTVTPMRMLSNGGPTTAYTTLRIGRIS